MHDPKRLISKVTHADLQPHTPLPKNE